MSFESLKQKKKLILETTMYRKVFSYEDPSVFLFGSGWEQLQRRQFAPRLVKNFKKKIFSHILRQTDFCVTHDLKYSGFSSPWTTVYILTYK
jgi:hypothetical protein